MAQRNAEQRPGAGQQQPFEQRLREQLARDAPSVRITARS